MAPPRFAREAAGLSTRFIAEGGLVIGRRRLAIFILSALVLLPPIVAAQDGRKLRAGYASLSGNMTPFWAAREAGLFKKYGLDIDLVAFPSGTEGMAAMIAGEIEFLAIAGSTTASAAIGGADVISLGNTVERLVTSLMVNPSIQKPEDLKGKAVGISRFGTSIDTAARMAIHHYGYEPMKDVTIVQVGAVSSAVAALRGGASKRRSYRIRRSFARGAKVSVKCWTSHHSASPTRPPVSRFGAASWHSGEMS